MLRDHGIKRFIGKYGAKFTKNLQGFVAAELMKGKEQRTEAAVDGEKCQIEGSTLQSIKTKETVC